MAKKTSPYIQTKNERLLLEYEKLKKMLPPFAIEFLDSKHNITMSSKVSYAKDLLRFFQFAIDSSDNPENQKPFNLTLDDISKFDRVFFDAYVSYLMENIHGNYSGNNKNSVERKFVPVRGIYLYFCNNGDIPKNPLANYEHFKEPEAKSIIHLDRDEVSEIIKAVTEGTNEKLTERAKKYRNKTRKRDVAIILLLLGTGIRVSECVGADLSDLNFKENRLSVVRKGEHNDYVYFDEDVAKMLKEYIEDERSLITPYNEKESPLFYSLQGKRVSVDTVERIVSLYSANITDKHISPHKLRATYGTALYKATGDLALTQDALGHASPTTTKRFYVDSRADNMKKAAQIKKY